MTEAFNNFSFSQTFGWTPAQIRGLTFEEHMTYVSILKGVSQAKPPEPK